MSGPKIEIVPQSLERGATEVHTIGSVISGAGHRLLSLPTPHGLPPEIPGQLIQINADLQHAGRVLKQQRAWLLDRAELARKADAETVGSDLNSNAPLFSADPKVATGGETLSAGVASLIAGGVVGGDSHRVTAGTVRPDRHKGDDWRGDDDSAASNLDAIESDARGDADRLHALDKAHKVPEPDKTATDGEHSGGSSKRGPDNGEHKSRSRTVTSGESTSGGDPRGPGNGDD